MEPLQIDFARRRRSLSKAGLFLLTLAAVAATGLSYTHSQAVSEKIELNRALDALNGKSGLDSYTAARLAGKDISEEVRRANRVIAHLSLPWESLFTSLEQAKDLKVALLNIEPEVEKRGLVLTGEAKTLDAMLEFVRYLQAQECLSNVNLQTHKVNLQDPEKPIRFRILATWVIT